MPICTNSFICENEKDSLNDNCKGERNSINTTIKHAIIHILKVVSSLSLIWNLKKLYLHQIPK